MASAEEALRAGRTKEALSLLEQEVRGDPSDAKKRIFLFQVLCILGQWQRALTQLNVAAEIDGSALLMAEIYRRALPCEALRAEIFAGKRAPLLFGEPAEWVGRMVEATRLVAESRFDEATQVRSAALELAPAIAGTIQNKSGEHRFEWIADSDGRLGPILEAVIQEKYFWIPLAHIRQIEFEVPEDLRDLVWSPAKFVWSNGGSAVGLVPTRYVGSESSDDPAIQMARKTEFDEPADGFLLGKGQRMFATDDGEYPILETRQISLDPGSS